MEDKYMSLPRPQQHLSQSVKDAERRALIYWVNSFNNPYCLLASSSNDFKDGIVFCELMGLFKGSPLSGVAKDGPTTGEKSMKNIALAVAELKRWAKFGLSPLLSAEDVYGTEDAMYELLKSIRKLFVDNNPVAESPADVLSESQKQETAKFPLDVLQSSEKSNKSPAPGPERTLKSTKRRNEFVARTQKTSPSKQKPSRVPSSGKTSPITTRRLDKGANASLDGISSRSKAQKGSVATRLTRQPSISERENVSPGVSRQRTKDTPATASNETKVPVTTRHKILDWLQDIRLIKESVVSIAEFPGYCRNGVLLFDLITRLEGRECTLKGVDRNPRTGTVVLANVKKCLEHLRSHERMNSRHLWAEQSIIQGNPEAIWGLLEDLWHFFTRKGQHRESLSGGTAEGVSTRRTQQINFDLGKEESLTRSPFGRKKSSLAEYATPTLDRSRTEAKQQSKDTTPPESRPVLEQLGTMRTYRRTSGRASYSQIHSRSPLRSQRSSSATRRDDLHRSTTRRPASNSYREETYRFPKIDEEKERITRIWLKSLNLTVLSAEEGEDILRNPYRNGLVLCELVELLENAKVPGKVRRPTAVRQAQHNIQRALRLFQERKGLPAHYSDTVECIRGILCGHKDVIWGLLSSIRETYPQTEPRNQPYLHLTNTGLPYLLPQLRKLELSLLLWLKSLGLVAEKPRGRVVSLLEVEHEIRNGTLLCDLAQIVGRKHISGVFRSPKTDSTALANIRKALECFRSLPRFNQTRYLWAEKELFNGDRGAILGLLEALHRYYDGVYSAPLPGTPYLGQDEIEAGLSYSTAEPPSVSLVPHSTSQHERDLERTVLSTASIDMPMLVSEKVPLVPESTFGLVNVRPKEMEMSIVLPPRQDSSYKPQATLRRKLFNYERPEDIEPRVPEPQEPARVPSQPSGSSGKLMNSVLTDWLKSIGIKLPSNFTLNGPVLNHFCSGVLLCEIVGALEKKTIEGVTENPQSSASALHNIRKALAVLEKKNAVPIYYAYSSEAIHEGNPELILGLLKNLKHAYRDCEFKKRNSSSRGREESGMRRTLYSSQTHTIDFLNCPLCRILVPLSLSTQGSRGKSYQRYRNGRKVRWRHFPHAGPVKSVSLMLWFRAMHILYSYKGYKMCGELRKQLYDCRKKHKDHYRKSAMLCKPETLAYLECYSQIVEKGKTQCMTEYKKAHSCLAEAKPAYWGEAPQGICREYIEAFINCKYE